MGVYKHDSVTVGIAVFTLLASYINYQNIKEVEE
jgi:hypothetical protein